MEISKLSLHTWLLAFIFMSADTAFRLMHKVRAMMGKRDSLYILKDMVEFDECFVRWKLINR